MQKEETKSKAKTARRTTGAEPARRTTGAEPTRRTAKEPEVTQQTAKGSGSTRRTTGAEPTRWTATTKKGVVCDRPVRRSRKNVVAIMTVVAVIVAVVVAFTAANFTFISDVFVGMRYQPSAEMREIFDALELTNDGQRIFNASLPELLQKEDFNQKCREQSNELAILGCYTERRIYVYDISSEELKGIKELTTAHELLHAVYARMSDGEKWQLNDALAKVYEQNTERLGDELVAYADEQRAEELYVRAGTEIKNLSEELERHYAKIFKEQDKVVDFYESYITVFEKIEQKMNELLSEINRLSAEVEDKVAEYETRVGSLNAQAEEFNTCARTENCFASRAVFEARRGELLAEQEALKTLYAEINSLVEQHNKLVSEYNENVLHGQKLNKVINSSEEVGS